MYEDIVVSVGEETRTDIRLGQRALRGEEVIIHAHSMRTSQMLYRKPISEIRLSAQQINAVPQVAEADLLRSLHSLPGVVTLSDFSSAL